MTLLSIFVIRSFTQKKSSKLFKREGKRGGLKKIRTLTPLKPIAFLKLNIQQRVLEIAI